MPASCGRTGVVCSQCYIGTTDHIDGGRLSSSDQFSVEFHKETAYIVGTEVFSVFACGHSKSRFLREKVTPGERYAVGKHENRFLSLGVTEVHCDLRLLPKVDARLTMNFH